MKYILPAIITAIASITVAIVAANATIRAAEGRLTKIQKRTDTLSDLTRLPVGTLLASMLQPKQFAAGVGDPSDYDPKKSQWTLADDKGPMPGTKWAELTDNKPVPDLRGLFLRGANHGRKGVWADPGGDRAPGESQADELKQHNHMDGEFGIIFRRAKAGEDATPHGTDVSPGEANLDQIKFLKPAGGVETRPRNAAVFYYLRVS
jgi:hypothetical protein